MRNRRGFEGRDSLVLICTSASTSSPLTNAHHRPSQNRDSNANRVHYLQIYFRRRDVSTRVNSAPPSFADCCLIQHHHHHHQLSIILLSIHPNSISLSLSNTVFATKNPSSNKPSQTRPSIHCFYRYLSRLRRVPPSHQFVVRFCSISKLTIPDTSEPRSRPPQPATFIVLRENALDPVCWLSLPGVASERLIVRASLPLACSYISHGCCFTSIIHLPHPIIPLTNERVAESLPIFGVLLGLPVVSGRVRGCDGGDSFSPVHACLLGSSNIKPVHSICTVPVVVELQCIPLLESTLFIRSSILSEERLS